MSGMDSNTRALHAAMRKALADAHIDCISIETPPSIAVSGMFIRVNILHDGRPKYYNTIVSSIPTGEALDSFIADAVFHCKEVYGL